jgi:hypothetical protein
MELDHIQMHNILEAREKQNLVTFGLILSTNLSSKIITTRASAIYRKTLLEVEYLQMSRGMLIKEF